MCLTEILAAEPGLKMAYAQKKPESVVTGLGKPINDHLLMRWSMPDSEHREHRFNEIAVAEPIQTRSAHSDQTYIIQAIIV